MVSDEGARIKLKMTRPTHASKSSVGGLTTAAKNIILTLINSSNNDINNRLHDEDINRFVKSLVKGQAKSSAKHILGNLHNNIYNSPQPEPTTPQSYADEPTSSIEKMLLSHA